jgi:RNA polymerase sigma factor (sigma-70 family)
MKSIRNECLPPLDRNEEIALFKAYRGRKHDQAAKEKLCRANFALVIKLAGKFASTELDVDELISQGLLKLVVCIENFDLKQGYRFSTYLTRALVFGFMRAKSNERRHQSGRIDTGTYEGDEDGVSLAELAPADDTRETDELLADLEAAVKSNRAGLEPLELSAVTLTFFGEGRTPVEVGLALGLSRKQVVALVESGIEKLRACLQ